MSTKAERKSLVERRKIRCICTAGPLTFCLKGLRHPLNINLLPSFYALSTHLSTSLFQVILNISLSLYPNDYPLPVTVLICYILSSSSLVQVILQSDFRPTLNGLPYPQLKARGEEIFKFQNLDPAMPPKRPSLTARQSSFYTLGDEDRAAGVWMPASADSLVTPVQKSMHFTVFCSCLGSKIRPWAVL